MRVLFLVAAAMFILDSQTDLTAAEKEHIFSVAKVNGRTKIIAGRTYHLVAVRFDPLPLLSVSGSRGPFWIFDGGFGKARMRWVESKELKGDLPLGLQLSWLRPASSCYAMVTSHSSPR